MPRLALLLLLSLLAGSGCRSHRPPIPPPDDLPIQELHLLTLPTALNLDGQPGADGLAVKIFAINAQTPRGTDIRHGRLEIHAFEGSLDPTRRTEVFRSWSFTPEQLEPHRFTAALGVGYNLVLDWTPRHLRSRRVTVVAQYFPPSGPPIVSAPSFVAATTL